MQICNSIVIATELESFYISKRDISVEDEVFINLLFPDRTFGGKTKTTGEDGKRRAELTIGGMGA